MPLCYGVDYDKVIKKCYYRSEYMDESTEAAPNEDFDSATIVFSACNLSDTCPGVNLKICTINNEPFQFYCGKGTWAANLRATTGTSLGDCARQCQADAKCQGVDFGNPEKTCYLKSAYLTPATVSTVIDSLVPLKPRP